MQQSSLLGRVIRTREVAGFRLSENLYARNTSVPLHVHNQAVLWIALEGNCKEVYARKVRDHETFTIAFLPDNEPHSLHFPRVEMQSFGINFSPQWLERTRDYSLSLDYSIHTRRGLLVRLFMTLYQEFRRGDSASSLAIEGLILEMLAEVSRRQANGSTLYPPLWLTKALELLHDQFAETLTIPQMAVSVGVHPVHFAREFRRFYGCTVGEYVRQLRIEAACRKLRMSETPLAAIAAATGFADQTHFSRTFKRVVRMTPAEYRHTFRSR
jgi:AraC family transcriptional regulator